MRYLLQPRPVTETETRKKSKWRSLFPVFLLFLFVCFSPLHGMEVTKLFSALARRTPAHIPRMGDLCGLGRLAVCTALDDAKLNSLFWIGANYHSPMDLSDTTGLSWREGILRCLESVQLWSRTSLPSSPSPIPQSSLSAAADSSPPPSVAHSSPTSFWIFIEILTNLLFWQGAGQYWNAVLAVCQSQSTRTANQSQHI